MPPRPAWACASGSPDLRRQLPDAVRVDVPRHRRRRGSPGGPVGAAARSDRGCLPLLEQRPRPRLSRARGDPGRPRYGRHRPGDGLRQPQRRFGDGRPVHPQPRHRRAAHLRRRHVQRPGRGRRGGHPPDRADHRASTSGCPAVGRELQEYAATARASPPRPVRHRVHDRAREALDAPVPDRQAEPAGGAADRASTWPRTRTSRSPARRRWHGWRRSSPTRRR